MRRPNEVIAPRRERAEIGQELLGVFERLRLGRLQPAKARDVFDPARFQGQHHFREIEPFHFRQFLRRALEVFALRPEPQAMSGRGPAGAAGALIGGGAADLLDEERVDPAPRIEARDPGEPAVDHDPHAVDREGSFRDVRGHDHFAFLVGRERGVLFVRREFAVKRERDEALAHPRGAERGDRARDLVFSRHENEHVALRLSRRAARVHPRPGPRSGNFRRGPVSSRYSIATGCVRPLEVRIGQGARYFSSLSGLERGGHDDELEIGARRFLQLQRARERDVAVEMALVKFIEKNRRRLRAAPGPGAAGGEEFPRSQNGCGSCAEATSLEADLVADFVA